MRLSREIEGEHRTERMIQGGMGKNCEWVFSRKHVTCLEFPNRSSGFVRPFRHQYRSKRDPTKPNEIHLPVVSPTAWKSSSSFSNPKQVPKEVYDTSQCRFPQRSRCHRPLRLGCGLKCTPFEPLVALDTVQHSASECFASI